MWQEEKRNKSGKEIGTRGRRQVIGMMAIQWILLWILLGVKMLANGGSLGRNPAHQEIESDLLTALFPGGREKTIWKVTDSRDDGW